MASKKVLAARAKRKARRAEEQRLGTGQQEVSRARLEKLVAEKGAKAGALAHTEERKEARDVARGFTTEEKFAKGGPEEQRLAAQKSTGNKFTLDRTQEDVTAPTIDLTKTRAPIDLTTKEPEKTGISALREEDGIVGAAIRVATDWRTTVALVATVASLGILSAGAATAAAGATASRAVVSSTVSAHRLVRTAQGAEKLLGAGVRTATRSFVGKPAIPKAVSKIFSKATPAVKAYASNTKTQALTVSKLVKGGMAVGVAAFVVKEAVDTYPFTEFELAEATDKIGIAIFQASNAGDLDEVARLQEILEEMTNPNVWDSILLKLPGANVMKAARDNARAALISADSIRKSTEKKLADAQAKAEAKAAEPTFAEERETADVEARERELTERKEDEEFFTKRADERRETELRERAEDEEFFTKRTEERTAAKEEERAADEAYWDNIVKKNEKRKEDERAADEEYWKKIKEENTTEPWTPADKKVIDNWNAGKSALNFKWLGL